MTHAKLVVMLEPEHDTPEAQERRIAELMAPYNENMEVPPYEVDCDCNWLLKRDENDEIERDENGVGIRVYFDHPKDCSDCHGSGKRTSTYNPESRWDWYQVLRTDITRREWHRTPAEGMGYIQHWLDGEYVPTRSDEEIDADTWLSDKEKERLKQLPGITPYAILGVESGWQERGTLGWWGISTDEDDDWDAKYFSIFRHFRDRGYVPVVVDYHI